MAPRRGMDYGTQRIGVTKVQRSSDGFKTPTGTTLTCKRCREDENLDAGVEPHPIATWLLTGEGHQLSVQPIELAHRIPQKRTAVLGLCSDHFKALRERNKQPREVGLSDFNFNNAAEAFWDAGANVGPSDSQDYTPPRA